eukprot:COSAG02_NODE_61111_length_269_cov_0.911765_1_plen_44_part_01
MVVDGEVGATSILRYLNHSCEPNTQMKYVSFSYFCVLASTSWLI